MNLKNKMYLLATSILTSPIFAKAQTTGGTGGTTAQPKTNDGSTYFQDVMTVNGANNTDATFNGINDVLKKILNFARGGGVIICIIMLVWCAIQLASSAGNERQRSQAMDGIKNVLIATAIIGAATVIASLAYGILNK